MLIFRDRLGNRFERQDASHRAGSEKIVDFLMTPENIFAPPRLRAECARRKLDGGFSKRGKSRRRILRDFLANDRFREAVRRASYRYSLSHSPFRLGHELCGITSMLSLIGIPFFRLVVFPFVRSINQHSCNTTWIRTLRSGAIGIPNEEKKRRKGTR